jgi:hypothetical protein
MSAQLNIISYIKAILEKCYLLQKEINERSAFEIISIEHNKNNECVVCVQITGKTNIFKLTPQEIISDDKLLEGFSKKNIRTLTYYATQEIQKPQYKILLQEICEKFNTMKFKLGKRGISTALEKTAEEISLDKELLNDLSPADAHTIGYTIATEQMLKEKEDMRIIKEKSNPAN